MRNRCAGIGDGGSRGWRPDTLHTTVARTVSDTLGSLRAIDPYDNFELVSAVLEPRGT
jgi:hypothetical protein